MKKLLLSMVNVLISGTKSAQAVMEREPLYPDASKVPASSRNYPRMVQHIHSDFDSAAETLLSEARALIDKANENEFLKGVNLKKAEQLRKLGFTGVAEVAQVKEAKEKAAAAKRVAEEARVLADLICYYTVAYPTCKFITHDRVMEICTKYKLVLGTVGQYTGFVPEKNLNQIAQFRLKEEDQGIQAHIRHTDRRGRVDSIERIFLKGAYISKRNQEAVPSHLRTTTKADEFFYRHLNEVFTWSSPYYHIWKKGEKGENRFAFQSEDGVSFYSSDDYNLFGLVSKGDMRFSVAPNGLMICAPEKSMNTQGQEIVNNILVPEFKDPIVLAPVNGGYLIVTMWGDENFDPANEPDLLSQSN